MGDLAALWSPSEGGKLSHSQITWTYVSPPPIPILSQKANWACRLGWCGINQNVKKEKKKLLFHIVFTWSSNAALLVLSNFLFSSHRFSFCSDYTWESSSICYSWRLLQCCQMPAGIYDSFFPWNVHRGKKKKVCVTGLEL